MNERITIVHEAKDEPAITVTSDKLAFYWTPRSIIFATVIAVAIGLGFLLLYRFYMIVFLFFVAFSLATALKPVST